MLKELRENIEKELKKIRKTICEEYLQRESIKRNQVEILELKNGITQSKKSLEGFNSRLRQKKELGNSNTGL